MDLFWFVIDENVANPFDFVSLDNINNSISIGIIKDIQSIVVEANPFALDNHGKHYFACPMIMDY
jgi:hypothetical protein